MSQSTSIAFYTERELPNLQFVLQALLEWLQATSISAYRFSGPDTSWEDYFTDREDSASCIHKSGISVPKAAELYQGGKHMFLDLASPFGHEICALAGKEIPESIRNDHWPHNLTVHAGPHDIIENMESPQGGALIARTSLSVEFWGYNVPNDLNEYRRRVLALPLLTEIHRGLESIAGPMKCCIYAYI